MVKRLAIFASCVCKIGYGYIAWRFDNKGCTGNGHGVKDDLEQEAGICIMIEYNSQLHKR